MLSPLKPLLCRHDYFWSERHKAELCRRCGKPNAPQPESPVLMPFADWPKPVATVRPPEPVMGAPVEDSFLDIPIFDAPLPPKRAAASDKVLKAQAKLRRDALLALLDRLAEGRQPSREEAIDAVLAVIEDAHSSDPVLFGDQAAVHFARLHETRTSLIF